MGEWTIYSKSNVAKAVVKELELHDEWMAECFITVSVKSATPIDFAVGDYIDYRGERYTIEYNPNVLKKASSGTYGEGFTYDNIKFVGLQDEIVRCDFNDIVLNDNDIHYTALPTFPFYCESVDDLLDRIQANLEELYPGGWIVIGLNTVRNSQRGTAVGRATAFENAYKQYIDPTGATKTDPYGVQGVSESVDNNTCWDALKKVHDDFELNFIIRGRVVIVGTAGVFTANTFRYGKGNGLYEIERVGEAEQRIVTRLRAYGSETNLPDRYYAMLNVQVFANITSIKNKFGVVGCDFLLDLDFDRKYFTYRSESYPGTTENPNYIVEISANDIQVRGYITKDTETGKCYVYCEYTGGDDDRDEPDPEKMEAFVEALTQGDRVDFVDYVKKDAFDSDHQDYSTENLPDNMAVSRLMLPGFPNMSLNAWVQAHKNDADKTWLAQAIADGFTFSTDKYRPFIDSPNKTQYGVRPASIYFDGSNETDDIHPTIEGVEYDNAPIDEIYSAEQVSDNGVYPAGEEVKNINIVLPDLGFDLAKVWDEGASIDMKNGMCGARSFKIANKPTKDNNTNRWNCNVERVHDDSLDLWFPYCDFQIHGSSEQGVEHGDKYVLTGITMPSEYIDFAAIKLLQASIEALKKNHAPRYTYQPRIDEIWMQRQHDTAMSSSGVVSLHDTLKAGDVFSFADSDLNIDANIIIDVLTIKENGNDGLPTYEVTLRDEKDVSTIEKITNKIDSVFTNAVASAGGGGLTPRQVQSLIDRFGSEQFLSKLNDDTAAGFITMLKGLQVGNQFVSGLLGEGGVFRKNVDGTTYLEADKMYVRMKAYFDNLEVRDYQHSKGNRVASPANCKCIRVEGLDSNGQVTEVAADIVKYRCYFRGSDGDNTITNDFVIGDQAYCHVTNVTSGELYQHSFWRLVIGKSSSVNDNDEHYIDLSNAVSETISGVSYSGYQSGSDTPLAQDDIVQLGNVNDSTRQGAVIEYVSGADAPSYQIYQGINSFSLNGKSKIILGYNSSTGHAELKVYGDAYIGDVNRSTYIEYKQDDGTQQHNPVLNIKAVIDASSPIGGTSTASGTLGGALKDLQDQIDGEIQSWFLDGTPTLLNEPAVSWNTVTLKERHLGDLYYDVAPSTQSQTSGFAYRFIKTTEGGVDTYSWQYIDDTAITQALAAAYEALGLADSKAKVYQTTSGTLPSAPYKVGDLWVNATYPADGSTYSNEILKCITACAEGGTPNISHWAKASKYTDDSSFNGYIDALLNGTQTTGDKNTAAVIQRAITNALGGATVIAGGLMLTSMIGLRQFNGGDASVLSNYTTWAGISGEYDAQALGGGIAAWYGGGMLDKETLTDPQISQGWNTLRWAKGVDRFDGSGYRADGNISWNANGALTIKNITTLSDSNNNNILNELATFNSAFTFGTSGQGSTTALYITPNVPFESLYIGTSNANKQEVATKNWVNQNFVTTTFFDNLFRLYNGYGNSATQINVNGTLPTDQTNLNIEAMFGFWTKKFISALGQGDDGTTSYTTLAQLNDVTLTNPTANQVLSYNGTHWVNRSIELGSQTLADLTDVVITSPTANQMLGYDATNQKWINVNVPETYTLPAASTTALGGIKIGYSGTTAKTYPVVLDSGNKAYVSVPWENTWTAWAGATSTAAGTAGYMPAPTIAQRNQFLRGDGTWVSLNDYSLPLSANGTRGGIQIGYTSTASNFAVQLSSEKAYVALPLSLTANAAGFSISGGTTSKTLTIAESYTLGAACAKGVTDNSSNADVTSSDINLITGRTLYYQLAKKGYTTNTGTVTSVATGTGLTGGTITGSGTISINSTYQTYISNGNTAFGWGNHATAGYLLKSGGTMTGALTLNAVPVDWLFTALTNNAGVWLAHKDGYGASIESTTTSASVYLLQCVYGATTLGVDGNYALVVKGNGNVGVGTNSPSVKLDVDGYSHFKYGAKFTSICIETDNSISSNGQRLSEINCYDTALYLQHNTNKDICMCAGGGGGNVGIGTTTPSEKLDVAGNIKTSTSNGAYIQVGAIRLVYDSTNNAIKVIKSDGTNANLYSTGGISALGANTESGGGGNYLPLSGGTLTGNLTVNAAQTQIGSGNRYTQNSTRSQVHHLFTGDDCDFGVVKIVHTSTYGNGVAGGYSASLGIHDQRIDNLYGDFEPTLYINRSGATRTPDLFGCDVGGTRKVTISSNGTLWAKGGFKADRLCIECNPDGTAQGTYGSEVNLYNGGIYIQHSSNGDVYMCSGGGNVGVGNYNPSYKLHVTGSVGATGYNNTSDIRKKNVIKDIDLRLDQIAKAPAFEYYWLDTSIDHDLHVGTSAQYWESVLPEVVSRAKDEIGTLSMQYGVAALVSVITVARKVMTHEEEIALLKTRVSALEKENGEQEQLINSLQEELNKYKAA